MSDIVQAPLGDRVAQPAALALRELFDDDACPLLQGRKLAAERRGDRNPVEFVEHALALARLSAPPGRDIRHDEILAEQPAGERGQEGEHSARFDHAGPGHVLNRDAALPDGLEQAGNADVRGRVQFQRVAPIGVDISPQDVATFEAGDRPDEDPTFPHDEIVAFHQQKAEIAREIGLLVVGEAQGTGTQDTDARLRARAGGLQPCSERAKEWGEPFDIELCIEIRKGLGDDESILQRVAAARGSLRPVSEHPPSAVRPAADIGGVETQAPAAGRPDAAHRGNKIHRACDSCGGKRAFRDQAAFAISVGENALQQLGPLNDAAYDLAPLGFGDQQRHSADRPDPLVLLAGDPVGKPTASDSPIGGRESLSHFVRLERGESGKQATPMRTTAALLIHEFIRNAGQGVVTARPGVEALDGGILCGDRGRHLSNHASPIIPRRREETVSPLMAPGQYARQVLPAPAGRRSHTQFATLCHDLSKGHWRGAQRPLSSCRPSTRANPKRASLPMSALRTAALLAALSSLSSPLMSAHANSLDPDLIFRKSTTFKFLTPNDKLAVYGIDDPVVEGVACHYTTPEKGGISGALGLAEQTSDISLACRQYGPIKFKEKFSQGDVVFSERRSILFKKMQIVRGCDTRRNILVYMTYSDKLIEGSPKNSTSTVPIQPWGGAAGDVQKCADFVR